MLTLFSTQSCLNLAVIEGKYKTFLSTDAVAYSRAYFGVGSGPIVLDDVRCTGSETALINCTYDRFTSDCGHYEDAGVRCQGQILLYEDSYIGQLNFKCRLVTLVKVLYCVVCC